jgi:uncharacterized protein YbjT (DUF2867 family)
MEKQSAHILLTGATGYVGGRLVPRLLDAGYDVRLLVRDPVRARGKAWADRVEILQGDLTLPETIPATRQGIDVA